LSLDTSSENYGTEVDKVYKMVLEGKALVGDTEIAGDEEAKLMMHIRTAALEYYLIWSQNLILLRGSLMKQYSQLRDGKIRIVTIFDLDAEGDVDDMNRVGW